MGRALLTDLYELNMAASYIRRGMTGPATFSLFVRDLPAGWGFLVACGLEPCLEFLETMAFDQDDLAYLAQSQKYPDEILDALGDLRFTGQVHAIPEGRLAFPDEPLLEVTAPLPEAQIVETYLLNQVTYQTAIASKAARCRLAAPDKDMVDFSFRRVHGVEAGMAVARATAIAGFTATSNVQAAQTYGLRATGTMAHSYVEAFGSEREAFAAFAEDFPDQVVLLVDTYDTAGGVQKAIEVGRGLAERGRQLTGIRLDSGDMGTLARDARRALDEAGLTETRIIASGGLDERVIAGLADSPIDAFGVGTKMGVSADAPYLDSVYKLVEYEGRPVAKLSTAKATLPGPKQVWRRTGMAGDVIGLRDEEGLEGNEPLLIPVMEKGKKTSEGTLDEARQRFAADLAGLPDALRNLDGGEYPVEHSGALARLAQDVRKEIGTRELGEG